MINQIAQQNLPCSLVFLVTHIEDQYYSNLDITAKAMNFLTKNSLLQKNEERRYNGDLASFCIHPAKRMRCTNLDGLGLSPRWSLCYMLHKLDILCLSFRNSEYSCKHFVSDSIQRTHFVIAGFQPGFVIKGHFLILRRGAQRAQVKYFFYLLIGDMIHPRLPFDRCSGLEIERGYTSITGKFPPVLETGEVMGSGNQIRSHKQSNAFNLGNEVKGPADLRIAFDKRLDFFLQLLYFNFQGGNKPTIGFKQRSKVGGIQEPFLFLYGRLEPSPVPYKPIPQRKKRLQLEDRLRRQFRGLNSIPMPVGIFSNPSCIDQVVLTPRYSHGFFDLQRGSHRIRDLPFFKVDGQRNGVKAGMLKTHHCPG